MKSLAIYTIFILSILRIPEASCRPQNGSLSLEAAQSGLEPAERFEVDKDVKFLLYTRKNPAAAQTISVGNSASLGNFNPQHVTKIITHGWLSNPAHLDGFRSAYMNSGEDYNVILVDWSKGASNLVYAVSRAHVVAVGKYVAELVEMLVERGLAASQVHLIGHSLGAHISGIAGNRMNKGKVGRVTGLDPAGPLFGLGESPADRLDKSDASFVDVIHTCAGLLGWENPIGHADFYPNGGKMVQPGCGKDMADERGLGSCSHGRSYVYYEESITSKAGFVGTQCADWKTYQSGGCSHNARALMGERIPTRTNGKFYLATRSSAPFAEG